MKMNLLAILRVAVRALNRKKLRKALTMLGIIIGVGAVIAMVSIGQGAQAMVQDQINGMGSNMMMIMPGNIFFGGASLGAGAASTLTEEDVQAMVREIPTIAAASPVVRASGQFVFGNQNWFAQQIPSIHQAMLSSVSAQASAVTEKQVSELLRQRHKIQPGQTDDFLVRSLTDVAQASAQVTTLMTILLGSIAAISLIVGGIGIMNIMLVSVTERTREIGIRMAVGARPNTIRLQFLTESLVLSLAGGAVGVVIGGTLATLVSRVLGWPTLVSALSVLISFAFATSICIFFCYYPAHKAAALDPIDALRYE